MFRRKMVGVYINPEMDKRVAHTAIDLGVPKSRVYEYAASLLLYVLEILQRRGIRIRAAEGQLPPEEELLLLACKVLGLAKEEAP